jgi:hypothetical protein
MQLHQKLVQACSGLGINLLDIAQFVQINEHPNVACWGFDRAKKQNYIYVNPKVLRLPIECIQLILRHEILHYAGYKNLDSAKDFPKANIASDIVINKILTMAHEKTMKALCRRIYPASTKETVLALARPDINPDELGAHKKLWQQVWCKSEIPSPASIYYQIVALDDVDDNPFSVRDGASVNIVFRKIVDIDHDAKLGQLSFRIVNDLCNHLVYNGFSASKFSAAFKQIFVNKKSFNCTSVEEFVSRLESRQKLEETSNQIISALDNRSTRQLYPYELSRIGIIYVACGVSKRIPVFWNKTPESRKNSLAIYIDTSPSMECYQEKEVFLIDRLKSYFPARVYCFANDVKEIALDDFANGNYDAGYSTSFDAVIEHLLASQYDAGVVFTDGYSSVNSDNEEKFRQSRKRLFTVYFTEKDNVRSELDQLSEQTMTIAMD